MKNNHTIFAIHGAGMNAAAFDALAKHIKIRAITLPGHKVGDDSTCLSIDQAAAGVLNHAPQNEKIILLGHSMGGMIALRAAQDPRVAAVIILGAAAMMPVNPDLLQLARDNPLEAQKNMAKWGVFKNHPQADVIKQSVLHVFAATKLEALAQDLAFCDQEKNIASILPRINKPVLVIAGSEDKMVKATDSQLLSTLLPQGSYVEISGCGHMMMLEQPEKIAHEVSRFLSALS